MRRSSRGNPWHDARGRFCSGPQNGGVIRSEKTEEEYAKQTERRIAKNNKEDTADGISIDKEKYIENLGEKNEKQKRILKEASGNEGNVQGRADRRSDDRSPGEGRSHHGEGFSGAAGNAEPLLRSELNPERFKESLENGRETTPFGCYVDTHTVKELSEMKMFLSDDGLAGVAVENDGNICCAFKNSKCKTKGMVAHLLDVAKENGGTKMDCYGKALVNMYEANGFVPVARIPFNEKYVDKTDFNRKLLEEKPDVYVLMLAPKGTEQHISSKKDLASLPTFDGEDGYDNAMAYRNSLMRGEVSDI